MDNGMTRMFTHGLGVAVLTVGLSIPVHAQRLPTELEQMGELAAGFQGQLEANRELVRSMQDFENQLQAQLDEAFQAGLDLSFGILNKQLEVFFVKMRA